MKTEVEQRPARLGAFIRDRRDQILEEWSRRVRSLDIARSLSQPRLIDHLPELLSRVAHVIESTREGEPLSLADLPKLHALDRLHRGFDLKEVVDEYALLRRCVLDAFRAAHGDSVSVVQVQRFTETIDGAVSESVQYYAQQRNRILVALDRLTTSSPIGLPLQELLNRLLTVFVESSEAVDCSTILLVEDNRLRVRASIGLMIEVDPAFSLAIGEGFSGRIAATREPATLRQASDDPLVLSLHLRKGGVRALYGVPLIFNKEVLGVAHMGSRTAFDFSDEDRALFLVLTTRAAAFIHESIVQGQRRAAEEQFRALADNIPQLAWIADGAGSIYWYNRRWYEYTGTTLEDVEGWGWQRVQHPEHVERVVARIKVSFATGEVWEDLFPLRGRDGRYRWFLSRAIPIKDERGRVLRWFGTNTDVTEHRRIEEARDQFIAILGHDLRNPLNAIRMTTEILAARQTEPFVEKAAVRIASSAERMRIMIADLLDFTRGRLGGGIPVEPKPTDLRAVASVVLDEIAVAHPGTRIHMQVDGDPMGTWDGERLGQIIQNLVTNAIAHGDPSAGVRVVIDGRAPDEVVIAVVNQGHPIPAESIPHLFEPFRQLAGAKAPRSSLGLGLFIVSEIARAHHGTVSVESSAERGTRFAVRLPRHATTKDSSTKPSAARSTDQGR